MKWIVVRLGDSEGHDRRDGGERVEGSGAKAPKAPPLTTFEFRAAGSSELLGRRGGSATSSRSWTPTSFPVPRDRRHSLELELTFWRFLPQRLWHSSLVLLGQNENSSDVVNISIWKSCWWKNCGTRNGRDVAKEEGRAEGGMRKEQRKQTKKMYIFVPAATWDGGS